METINNTTSTITANNLLEILQLTQDRVLTEDGKLFTVLSVMNFHAGKRREEEIANANPGRPTVKAYVMTQEKGPIICNVFYGDGKFVFTHVEEMEGTEGFFKQISREVDRAEEGKKFLLSAWSMV